MHSSLNFLQPAAQDSFLVESIHLHCPCLSSLASSSFRVGSVSSAQLLGRAGLCTLGMVESKQIAEQAWLQNCSFTISAL